MKFPLTNKMNQSYLWVIILFFMILSAMGYSFYVQRVLSNTYTPLIHASLELQLKATTAHLWFEEMISGDRSVSLESVREHLDGAKWYANAMLNGGHNSETIIIPLEAPHLRQMIQTTLQGLSHFGLIAEKRWQIQFQSGVGSKSDQEFDQVFKELIHSAKQVELTLLKITEEKKEQFDMIQTLLILMVIITSLLVGIFFSYHENKQKKLLQKLIHQEQQVFDLLNSTAEAIIGVDMDGQCTFANPASLKLLGYKDDDKLLGQKIHPLLHHKHADGSHYPIDDCPMHLTLKTQTKAHTDDEMLWKSDGEGFHVEYWSYPIFRDNRVSL